MHISGYHRVTLLSGLKRILKCPYNVPANFEYIVLCHVWQFLPHLQAGFLAESLFRVFDEDKSGALSYYEFMQVS